MRAYYLVPTLGTGRPRFTNGPDDAGDLFRPDVPAGINWVQCARTAQWYLILATAPDLSPLDGQANAVKLLDSDLDSDLATLSANERRRLRTLLQERFPSLTLGQFGRKRDLLIGVGRALDNRANPDRAWVSD